MVKTNGYNAAWQAYAIHFMMFVYSMFFFSSFMVASYQKSINLET